jgi:hypothetical protein
MGDKEKRTIIVQKDRVSLIVCKTFETGNLEPNTKNAWLFPK